MWQAIKRYSFNEKWRYIAICIFFELVCVAFFIIKRDATFLIFLPFGFVFLRILIQQNYKNNIKTALSKTPKLALVFVDKCGFIKFINKKFENIFNLESKKYYNYTLDELIEKCKIYELCSFETLLNTVGNTKYFIVKKDSLYFRIAVSSVLKNAYKFDGFIITAIDVTHEKELENKEMEREKMLIANAKMAVVGEMISSISHQQRQPLSSILLCLDNIQECMQENKIEDIDKYLFRAKHGVKLMNDTIKSFRNFYKNDDKVVQFDIKDMISELIFIIKPQFGTNGIALEVKCQTDVNDDFKIKSIPSYIKQIMLSLLANAKDELMISSLNKLDFEPKVLINLNKTNGKIRIDISDNGNGIEDDNKIFEPFYTTKKDTGTGIGLCVAKNLAEQKLKAKLLLSNFKNPTTFSLFLDKGLKDSNVS